MNTARIRRAEKVMAALDPVTRADLFQYACRVTAERRGPVEVGVDVVFEARHGVEAECSASRIPCDTASVR